MNDLRDQVEQMRLKNEKAFRQVEKLKGKVQGSESVCISQQSLIEMQNHQIAKLKHKLKKYKRRVINRDQMIAALKQEVSNAPIFSV